MIDREPEPSANAEPGAGESPEARRARLEEVRERLERGELDTVTAAVETAAAMLDGDQPAVDTVPGSNRHSFP